MKNLSSTIWTLVIIVASIYFFYIYQFWVGVLLLIWAILRLAEYSFARIVESINRSTIEKRANIQIELSLNIAEILNNKIFEEALEKINKENREFYKTERGKKFLKESGKGEDILSIKEWKEKLIENYKKKYDNSEDFTAEDGTRYIWHKVKFNIKNNILWKDDKVFFSDFIMETISIPSEYKGKNGDNYFFANRFPAMADIRLLVVNGMIKLQVGDFDKRTTPKFIRKEGLAIYQKYQTITYFPLMYALYGIPLHYLNISSEAMDSWWNFWGGMTNKDNKDKWGEEWRGINKDVLDYGIISDEFAKESPSLNKTVKTIGVGFTKKLWAWRAKDGESFTSSEDKKDDGYTPDFMESDFVEYNSKILRISLLDYNRYLENKKKYMFSDYWEEHP